uniref:Uncharacterized protein n=1 Tax=Lutzomyia longipalpis TaxID=7200 RepID=A0A1B0CGB1_LUTLO
MAGTVGAVATCPLEVVKTRLQSSSAFLSAGPRVPELPGGGSGTPGSSTNSTDALLRPEQRRRLCTTILRKRPQIIAISSCGISSSAQSMSIMQCINFSHPQSGLRGFYKGITASYFGISETVIHFVIYEALKRKLIELRTAHPTEAKTSRDFVEFMLAGATSKTIASCVAYPHEVARTRLREEGSKYRSFWQTLATVWREEGRRGLYRGLATQLVRQIPNTAIMMTTYEGVVYILTRHFNSDFYGNDKHIVATNKS